MAHLSLQLLLHASLLGDLFRTLLLPAPLPFFFFSAVALPFGLAGTLRRVRRDARAGFVQVCRQQPHFLQTLDGLGLLNSLQRKRVGTSHAATTVPAEQKHLSVTSSLHSS